VPAALSDEGRDSDGGADRDASSDAGRCGQLAHPSGTLGDCPRSGPKICNSPPTSRHPLSTVCCLPGRYAQCFSGTPG